MNPCTTLRSQRQSDALALPAISMASTSSLSRTAPAPAGPDPYKLVVRDLEHIKSSIKKVLSDNKSGSGAISSNEVLTMAAREFMQRKGKSFRPMVVLLVGRATDPDFSINARHYKLSVIAEMIHTASLIHADVLEEDAFDDLPAAAGAETLPPYKQQGTVVHQEVDLDVGNKVCILAGDFLLAKAAVELSLLDCSEVTEIIARGLESICEGGMLAHDTPAYNVAENIEKASATNDADAADADGAPLTLGGHLHILSQGTAQLIGNSCQCSAILSGHEADSAVASACLVFGEGLAMAQELIAEAQAMEAILKKCRRAPKNWPRHLAPSTPLLVASDNFPERMAPLVRRHFSKAPADGAVAIACLDESDAVERTRALATEYAQDAADALMVLPVSATRDALLVLCHKILSGAPIK